jgi:membrane protease YdiL (CAAX protease family)
LPPGWLGLAFYHISYIGLSEELFFRGYLQQRLDAVFGRRYRLLGAACGPGLLLADLLFAFGHAALTLDLRRLDVFFPGLVFGWLQARTGATLAPALFHGLCNVLLFALRATAA